MWNQWPGIILMGFNQCEETLAVKGCEVYNGVWGVGHRGQELMAFGNGQP